MKTIHTTYEDWSIRLTKYCLIILLIAAIGLMCTGTWVVDLAIIYPSPFLQGDSRYLTMLILGYLLGILAVVFLLHLYQLVSRIGNEQIFIPRNVRSLQLLGWEMGLATIISFLLGISCYIPVLLITVAGIALTLVIRVIRNAFGKAVELQEQVDYTV